LRSGRSSSAVGLEHGRPIVPHAHDGPAQPIGLDQGLLGGLGGCELALRVVVFDKQREPGVYGCWATSEGSASTSAAPCGTRRRTAAESAAPPTTPGRWRTRRSVGRRGEPRPPSLADVTKSTMAALAGPSLQLVSAAVICRSPRSVIRSSQNPRLPTPKACRDQARASRTAPFRGHEQA
jgi:hypothetical protein